ncbi:DUF6221 family protein [Streptomyces californicus]|uniref:DUF6221 family protein n=1 Tax=Streptomyces californicus TaxID=67351 RepID=UPI0037D27A4F
MESEIQVGETAVPEALVEFLRARLAEDEAAARRVRGSWRQIGETGVVVASDGGSAEECANGNWGGIAEHIVRHDPVRILADVEAKRRLIARGGPFCTSECDDPDNEPRNPDTNWATPLEHHLDCDAHVAAGVLAVPYADHPDYQEDWRP